MMLSGLGTTLALRVIDRSEARQLDATAKDAQNARRIEAFLDRAGEISTVEAFIGDWEVYSFVLSAFDLDDQAFGKGMIRKIVESDASDKTSLVRRLTDGRFRELYDAVGFGPDGVSAAFSDPDWRAEMVDRFVQRQFINTQKDGNADLGAALDFRLKAPEVRTWYDVLKSKEVAQVVRTALGLPDSMATLDLDRQIEIFESKMDLADFRDPEKRDAMERKFAAIADANAAMTRQATSPVLHLMQAGAAFTPVTFDMEAIARMGRRVY